MSKKKRIDLDEDDELVVATFKLSKKDQEKLREEAFRRKRSQGSLLRESLKNHLKDVDKRRKILGEELDKILDDCGGWFGGFEIDGEDGFIERMVSEGLMLKDLSDDQWDRVKEKIKVGWDGYSDKPSSYKFVNKFVVLKPSEEHKDWLVSLGIEDDEEED